MKKILIAISFSVLPLLAFATADGPDAFRVKGVSSDDTLSVRIGPSTQYAKIGELAHDARHLQYTECVPYVTLAIWERLTDYQRENLPDRWCMIHDPATNIRGWVAGKYLWEDTAE